MTKRGEKVTDVTKTPLVMRHGVRPRMGIGTRKEEARVMATSTYEIDKVHDVGYLSTETEACEPDCEDHEHYYAVYERQFVNGEPHIALWVADYATLEEAQEAVDTKTFHTCGDECRSNGCTERHK
jgi:hypothetical protein